MNMRLRRLLIISVILLSGCASHKQLRCRFVAVDGRGKLLKAQTARMHSHWHQGFGPCVSMIEALAAGVVVETSTGNQAGVQAKGPKEMRLRLKNFFGAEPPSGGRQGVAEVRKPSFAKMGEIAQ